MGEEKFLIYNGFKNSNTERNDFNRLAAKMPPGNKISDENAEELIFGMYKARKSIMNEIYPGDVYNSSNLNESNYLRMIEMNTRIYKKYEEVSSSTLPPDQAELYNAELRKRLDQYEEEKRMVLLALEEKKYK